MGEQAVTAAGKGETDGLPARQRNWVMACVMLGIVLAGLDSAIANIALPTIARDLHTSESGPSSRAGLQWWRWAWRSPPRSGPPSPR